MLIEGEKLITDFLARCTDQNSGIITRDVLPEFSVAAGNDSVVYMSCDGTYVLKFYTQEKFTKKPTLNKLLLYQRITNEISYYCEISDLTINGQRFRVNPICSLVECREYGCIVGISTYIKGNKLEAYSPQYHCREIDLLSRKLGDNFGVSGIDIIPVNIKVLSGGTLMITDLCSSLSHLREI